MPSSDPPTADPSAETKDAPGETIAGDELEALRRRQAARFVARFDREEFWLAHEELEELWRQDREEIYKGLIQVAAGMLHVERANWRGARRLFRTASEYLDVEADEFRGFDVGALRRRAETLGEHVRRLAEGEIRAFDDGLRFPMTEHYAEPVDVDAIEDEELPPRVRRYEEGYDPTAGGGTPDDREAEDSEAR